MSRRARYLNDGRSFTARHKKQPHKKRFVRPNFDSVANRMLLIALLVLEQKPVLTVAFGLRSEEENILFCAVMLPLPRCSAACSSDATEHSWR